MYKCFSLGSDDDDDDHGDSDDDDNELFFLSAIATHTDYVCALMSSG